MISKNDFSELNTHLYLQGGPSGLPSGVDKPARYRGAYIEKKAEGAGFESTKGALDYAEGLKDFYLGQRNEVLGDTALSLLPIESDLSFQGGITQIAMTAESGVLNKGLIQTLVNNSPMLKVAYGQNSELGDLLYASVMSSGKEVGFDANYIEDGTLVEFGKIDGQDGMVRIITPDNTIYTFALYSDWLKGAQVALDAPATEPSEEPAVIELPEVPVVETIQLTHEGEAIDSEASVENSKPEPETVEKEEEVPEVASAPLEANPASEESATEASEVPDAEKAERVSLLNQVKARREGREAERAAEVPVEVSEEAPVTDVSVNLDSLENLGTVNIESNPEEPEEGSIENMPVVEPQAEVVEMSVVESQAEVVEMPGLEPQAEVVESESEPEVDEEGPNLADGLQALENLGTVNIESNPEEPEEVSTDEMPVVEPRAEPEEAP
ncbi:MAG: hypothetical protein ACI9QC_000359, partial [Oceanicoccus sp.]